MTRKATVNDLIAVARIHKVCFSEHFASHLCIDKECYLLQRFYNELYDLNPDYFIVSEEDGAVNGFCVGYRMVRDNFMGNFIKNNRFKVGLHTLRLLICFDKIAWLKVKRQFIKSTRPKFEVIDHKYDYISKEETADLLSICVLPEHRGKGYARQLIEDYLKILKDSGMKLCLLSVANENASAKGLYEKCGFIPYRKIGDEGMTYMKLL